MEHLILQAIVTLNLLVYPDAAEKEKEFIYVRGDTAAIGNFDSEGEFVQNRKITPYKYNEISGYSHVTGKTPAVVYAQGISLESQCYEYRSGYLIKGFFHVKDRDVFFVPELNSTVVNYNAKSFANDLMIYNLPSTHKAYWDDGRNVLSGKIFPEKLEYSKLPPPKGYQLVPQITEPTYKKYIKSYNNQIELGDIDSHGVFCPDYTTPLLPKLPFDKKYQHKNRFGVTVYLQFDLAQNGLEEEKVYEFRADRLIPGVLKGNTGLFVPTEGKKIISFSDYKIGKDVRIYNLPGFFAWRP